MNELRLNIQPRAPVIRLRIEQGHSVDWYKGEYEVTPKFEEQSLPTRDKTMRQDVVVHEIPIEVTINESGGNTITIGG